MGIPYSVIEHSSTNIRSSYLNSFLRKKYDEVITNSKNTFCVSFAQKVSLERHFGIKKNISVILNGFKQGEITDLEIVHNTKRRIVTVGFIGERKGHFKLAKALKKIVDSGFDIEWCIVGNGSEKEKLSKYIKSLGLEEFTKFLGIVPHDEVLKQMLQSDIFCLTSYNEPFGIVYMEAMSVGIPIVGSRGEGIEDIVSHMENGVLVDPFDSDDIANGIFALLGDMELCRKIGLAGKETVKYYSWDKNAKETLQAFTR